MSLPWFRMYAEFVGDPVIQSLAFEDQRHYVMLLCLKCDGVLDRPIQASARDRIIFRALGLDPVSASEAKRRLSEVGLIDKNWQIAAWDKRQYVSDVSTQRVRKCRKNKETGNVSETPGNRFGNGPDTDTDTDKKIGTKKGTQSPSRFAPPTLEEIREYCTERGNQVDPEKFHDFYAANGWVQGRGKPIRDWRAAVRTWERGEKVERIELPTGDDMATKSVLWSYCKEAGISGDEIKGKPVAEVRRMILERHPRAVA
jgi:hypothetical protein